MWIHQHECWPHPAVARRSGRSDVWPLPPKVPATHRQLPLVALADGGTQHGAILDGRACSALHAGDQPLVRLWQGKVIEVDWQGTSWSTANGPLRAVVGWAVTSVSAA